VFRADAGLYRCEVTDDFFTTSSESGRLTILNSLPPGGATLSVNLDGSQVVPSSGSQRTGSGTGVVQAVGGSTALPYFVELTIDHDVTDGTNASIFVGRVSQTGDVVLNLGNPASPIVFSQRVTADDAISFLAGDYYLQIFSSTRPNGEIRGQIQGTTPTPDGEALECDVQVAGTLSPCSAHFDRIESTSFSPTCSAVSVDADNDNMPFNAVQFEVTETTTFTAELDPRFTEISDPILALYCGVFDPMNPDVNLIAYDDDDGSVPGLPEFSSTDNISLVPGNIYSLVLTTFGGATTPMDNSFIPPETEIFGDFGDYVLCLPDTLNVVAVTGLGRDCFTLPEGEGPGECEGEEGECEGEGQTEAEGEAEFEAEFEAENEAEIEAEFEAELEAEVEAETEAETNRVSICDAMDRLVAVTENEELAPLLEALGDELDIIGELACDTADLNGPLPASEGEGESDAIVLPSGNGIPDGRYEFGVLEALINEPQTYVGLALGSLDGQVAVGVDSFAVQAAFEANQQALLEPLEEVLDLLPGILPLLLDGEPTQEQEDAILGLFPDIVTVLAGYATLGDTNSVNTVITVTTLVNGLLLDLLTLPATPEEFVRLEGILGPDGDADGDGCTQRAEYLLSIQDDKNATNYVQLALDPQRKPSDCAVTVMMHDADSNQNGELDLAELLRVIQLYNAGEYFCAAGDTDDGFSLVSVGLEFGSGDCTTHSSDFAGAPGIISLSELLRTIQFFNLGGVVPCPGQTEDGFCIPEV